MGFMDDLAEAKQARAHTQMLIDNEEQEEEKEDVDNDEGDNDNDNDRKFAERLKNDPELAAELRAVEKELAEAYPINSGDCDDDDDADDGSDGSSEKEENPAPVVD